MENSDARAVRLVRCLRCHSVLEEPCGVPVYRCGGCGTSIRAKIRTGGTGDVASVSSSSRSGPPPQSRHLNSSDVVALHRGLPSLRGARSQYPSTQPKHPAAKEAKRRLPTRSNYQPVLKGAPFIVCFRLVQVPADFAASTNDTVCKLRCGSCSDVLSYSYRDPARKKRYQDFIDQLNTDTFESQVEVALLFEDPDEPGSPGYQVGGCSTGVRDDNQVEQIPPEGTEKGLGRNIAPSWWEDVLQLPIGSGLPTPSIYQGSEATEELLSDHSQFEPYSRADATLTLGQKQWFDIRHICPEWAFSYEITKVIFTGDFLCDPYNFRWAVMFGDCEVPADVVQPGVLLCYTPLHTTGKLRVCITSRNREVCSEFKDFEIRVNASTSSLPDPVPSYRPLKSGEELLVLAKFARMLLSENGRAKVSDGDHQSVQFPKLRMNEELWQRLIDELTDGCANPLSMVYQIMEELLKSDLQEWLSVKVKGNDGNGTASLSKHEHGIIHSISALGYDWALSSVLSAGIGLNFRDSNGWTALHWAAYFGRETMVAALLAAGASATAVTNPTTQDPVGKPAAFLASERGYTGLAGYLSEVSLTRYIESLTIEERDVSKGSAEVEPDTAVERVSQWRAQLHDGTEYELSMGRDATQAAARIQNAFRAFSFRKRQQKTAASRSYHQTHASSGQFKMQVEDPHSTSYKDVMTWVAMGKQIQKRLNHICMQQVAHKHLGRDEIRQKIMENILSGTNGESNCTIIFINGGSGLGKTSLLRVLYSDQELLDAFDKRIWIQMSDKFDISMLFRKIIEFPMNYHCSITNVDLLQELVVEEITNKKLLLFLDDADIEDQQFWTSVLEVLNAGAKGSAIVIATRSNAALRDVATTHSYFLKPLPQENNMMILQQYSGVGADIQSNPDLIMVAERFISMFGSNPLNLKAIGSLLCHADSISLEMDKIEGSVMPLQLCHDVLPMHLKKCLAFCSLFREGYIFDKHHMILQWISHSCVKPVEERELEEVGIEYFNELMCRSFFQYSPAHNDKDGKFVMHELMYKVVESVNRDKYYKSEDLLNSVPENILHLSLVSSQFQTVELMSKTKDLNNLQTLMVVQPEWQPYKISFPTLKLVGLDDFFLKFTSIQTLDLSHTDTEDLPGSIVGLRNLQYLSVNNTGIKSLPSELCSLSNLQTLEAKDCRFLTELPGDTKKLLKLRHLDVTKELDYVHLPHGIGHLSELRTLPVFHASGDSSRCSISELQNLHNLRDCLRLSGLEIVKTGSKAQEANLKNKHHLKDLTLQWHDGGIEADDEDEDKDTENVAEQVLQSLQPHTNLQELAIRGYEGNSFPDWMQGSSSLPNLVSLTLHGCCNCTEFPAISQLPSLKFLSVRKMYCVQRLITNNIQGSTIKFPSLELLNLWEMYGLEELFESSDGDCPRLRKVCLSKCPDLKRLPCSPSVRELVLHCGHELPDIPELASLVSLKIEGFHGVKSFGLPALPLLKKVEIRSCKELVSVDGLSALTTVQRLKIAGCPKLVLPTTDGSLTT